MIRRARDERDLAEALRVRRIVFIEEQGVTEEGDLDGRDDEAIQLVAEQDGEIIATCRVLIEPAYAKFGRLAVLPAARGRGLGAELLRAAEQASREAGATTMTLDAQIDARTLYERAGYEARGPTFLDEGIEHITMTKRLT